MRKLWMLPVSGLIVLSVSCKQNPTDNTNAAAPKADTTAKKDSGRHNKLVIALTKDTNPNNFTDAGGKRQGYWVIRNTNMRLPGYDSNAKIEEGEYKDGMKEGEWTEYNADGSVKSSTTFKDGKPVR